MDSLLYKELITKNIHLILCIGYDPVIVKTCVEALFQIPDKTVELWIYDANIISFKSEWVHILQNTVYEKNIHFINASFFSDPSYQIKESQLLKECDCLFVNTSVNYFIPKNKKILMSK